jgi:metallothionein
MLDEGNKCEHPNCTCMAAEESDYCSVYCESSEDSLEITCGCGHTGCEGTQTRVA